jgi:hypothetical protein
METEERDAPARQDVFFSEGGGCRMILGDSMRDGFRNVLER